jgi:hypothetical protein
MKKAQLIISKTFIFMLLSIIAVAILFFGYQGIQEANKNSEVVQINLFINSLKKSIDQTKTYPYGSKETITLPLLSTINTVCFVDKSKTFNEFTNTQLSSQLSYYEGFNLFFMPLENNAPQRIYDFALEESPLCVKNVNRKVKLELKSLGNITQIAASDEEEKESDCISIAYNKDNNIDIVFLNYGYDDIDSFSRDVNEYIINVFSKIAPFDSNIDKFNFYRIDKQVGDICQIKGFIICDEFAIKKIASDCPNDYIFILVDRNKIADILNPVRSSAVSNMGKINTADNKFVLMHEYGHIFANLADEYVDDQYYSQFNFNEEDYPNCDSIPCPEWGTIGETGCFQGCSLSTYYRPTESSIMKSLKSRFYGPVNEKEIKNKLGAYK